MKTYKISELIAKNTQKYRFSTSSLKKLLNVDSRLVDLCFDIAKYIDIKVIQGYRTPEQQHALYSQGRSTKDGYIKKSKHQSHRAVDLLPLPKIKESSMYANSQENSLRWAYFTGFVQALALSKGIKIRAGWKWRTSPMNTLARPLSENTLVDSNHFEIRT